MTAEHKKVLSLITDEQNVDVTTKPGPVGQDLLNSSQEHAQQRLLHVVVAVDGRCQRLGQQLEDVLLLLGQVLALQDVFAGDGGRVL